MSEKEKKTIKIQFPYPTLIFKENKITEKKAFESLVEDNINYKNFIIEKDSSIIIHRPFSKFYFKSDGLSNFYTEKVRFDCKFSDNDTPLNIWELVISKEINLKKEKFSSYRQLEIYIYDNYSKIFKACNTFNPFIESYFIIDLINNFPIKEVKVLDSSSGWGDRLIGFLSTAESLKDLSFYYKGFDPNEDLKEGYQKIIKKFISKKNSKRIKAEVLTEQFEKAFVEENSFDICITSPPFYDLENYSENDSQSVNRTTKKISYNEWLNGFYKEYLNNICFATSKRIIIYTSNIKSFSSENVYKIYDDTIDLIKNKISNKGKFILDTNYDYYFLADDKLNDKNKRKIQVWNRNPNVEVTDIEEEKDFPYHFNSYGNSYKDNFFKNLMNAKITFFENKKETQKTFYDLISTKDKDFFLKNYKNNNTTAFNVELYNSTSRDFIWNNIDTLTDFYNEDARIRSVGYSEDFSPLEIFKNKSLQLLKGIINPNDNEEFFNKVKQARLAYCSFSKGLFEYIIKNNFSKEKFINILDIAAYGDRMLAASAVNKNNRNVINICYTGIDPDKNLNYSDIIQDINFYYNNNNNKFFNTSFENFIGLKTYDVVLISPPPYDMEKYDKDEENLEYKQSHMLYSSFENWVNGFLINTIIRKTKETYKPTLLAFTALDRFNKGYEIYYVEKFILLIEILGDYYYNSTLQFGPSRIPWFFFNKKIKKENIQNKINYFVENYSEYLDSKSFQNMILHSNNDVNFIEKLFIEDHTENINNNFSLNFCGKEKYSRNYKNYNENIREALMLYICNLLFNSLNRKIPLNKIIIMFSRLLMTASSLCHPLEKALSYDVMFVDITLNEKLMEICIEQFYNNIKYSYENVIKTFKGDYYKLLQDIFKNKYFMIESKENFKEICKGIFSVIRTAGNFMYITSLTNIDYNNESNFYKYVPFFGKFNKNKLSNSLVEERYKALGAEGHHFTRPLERAKILLEGIFEKKYSSSICLDLFATSFNQNSLNTDHYFSLYPDVEPNSLGNAFYLKSIEVKEKEGILLLCNPVDTPSYLKQSVFLIEKLLKNSIGNIAVSFGNVIWKDSNDYKMITQFYKDEVDKRTFFNNSNDFEHTALKYFSSKNFDKEYIKAVYILNKEKFPTIDKANDKVILTSERSEKNISFGIILNNNNDDFNMNISIISRLGEVLFFK